MLLVEKIKYIASQQGETLASIERTLGFGQGTIRKWDINSPSIDKLKKVIDLLNISVDWLLDQTATLESLSSSNLGLNKTEATIKEERLLELLISNFKLLSREGQDILVNQSAVLLEKEKDKIPDDEKITSFQVAAHGNSSATLKLTKEQIVKLEEIIKNSKEDDLKDLF